MNQKIEECKFQIKIFNQTEIEIVDSINMILFLITNKIVQTQTLITTIIIIIQEEDFMNNQMNIIQIISTHIIQEEYLMNNQMNTIQIIISILAGMITLLTEPMKTMVKYRIIIIIIE